jgi:hypothetical protein
MIGDDEGLVDAGTLRLGFARVGKGIGSTNVELADRTDGKTRFDAAGDAALGVCIAVVAAQWVGRWIQKIIKDDYLGQAGVEVGCRGLGAAIPEGLIDSSVDGPRSLRLQLRVAVGRVTGVTEAS